MPVDHRSQWNKIKLFSLLVMTTAIDSVLYLYNPVRAPNTPTAIATVAPRHALYAPQRAFLSRSYPVLGELHATIVPRTKESLRSLPRAQLALVDDLHRQALRLIERLRCASSHMPCCQPEPRATPHIADAPPASGIKCACPAVRENTDMVSSRPPPASVRKRATSTWPFSEAKSYGVTPVCAGGGEQSVRAVSQAQAGAQPALPACTSQAGLSEQQLSLRRGEMAEQRARR